MPLTLDVIVIVRIHVQKHISMFVVHCIKYYLIVHRFLVSEFRLFALVLFLVIVVAVHRSSPSEKYKTLQQTNTEHIVACETVRDKFPRWRNHFKESGNDMVLLLLLLHPQRMQLGGRCYNALVGDISPKHFWLRSVYRALSRHHHHWHHIWW